MSDQLALVDEAPPVERWASLSDDAVYRYLLGRRWDDGVLVGWVMLNPSTADATADDPRDLRRVGYHRATGRGNAAAMNALAELDLVVCAWGANARTGNGETVAAHLRDRGARLRCLGRTKAGAPRHPLYVRSDQPLEEYP